MLYTCADVNQGSQLSVDSFPNSPPAAAASWAEHEGPSRPVYLPGKTKYFYYLSINIILKLLKIKIKKSVSYVYHTFESCKFLVESAYLHL